MKSLNFWPTRKGSATDKNIANIYYGLFVNCLVKASQMARTKQTALTPSDVQAKSYPHRGTREGWCNPSLVFAMLQNFEKDFTFSRKPVMCSTRWGTYYGLPRCWGPVTSCKMATILGAILNFTEIRNYQKALKIGIFLCLTCRTGFCWNFLHFSPKKGKNHAFFFKNGLTTCYLWRHIS